MIPVTDLRNGMYYQEHGAPLEVLSYEHIKMGRGSATIKVKIKNLLTGAITTKSYISGKKVEEADIYEQSFEYKYRTSSEYIFVDDEGEETEVDTEILLNQGKYLLKNMKVKLVFYAKQPIGVKMPIKVTYVVKEAPPDARGNSATASYKEVVLANGLKVKTPMFVKPGDRVIIDTRNGDYISRE